MGVVKKEKRCTTSTDEEVHPPYKTTHRMCENGDEGMRCTIPTGREANSHDEVKTMTKEDMEGTRLPLNNTEEVEPRRTRADVMANT